MMGQEDPLEGRFPTITINWRFAKENVPVKLHLLFFLKKTSWQASCNIQILLSMQLGLGCTELKICSDKSVALTTKMMVARESL